MKIEELKRKQIRYILFRIKDALTHEQIVQRQKPKPPLRRVMEREVDDVVDEDGVVVVPAIKKPFKKGEASKVLKGWGYDLTAKEADDLVQEIQAHFEKDKFVSGWKFFSEPNGVFQAWDIGIDSDDKRTESARPDKRWLFGKGKMNVVLRGLQDDGKMAIEEETGRPAVKFETEVS